MFKYLESIKFFQWHTFIKIDESNLRLIVFFYSMYILVVLQKVQFENNQ